MPRYRLLPAPAQEAVPRDHRGHTRSVWNPAVESSTGTGGRAGRALLAICSSAGSSPPREVRAGRVRPVLTPACLPGPQPGDGVLDPAAVVRSSLGAVAAVVPQDRFLSGGGDEPVPGHANTLSGTTDISGGVKRRFLPGLKAGVSMPRS